MSQPHSAAFWCCRGKPSLHPVWGVGGREGGKERDAGSKASCPCLCVMSSSSFLPPCPKTSYGEEQPWTLRAWAREAMWLQVSLDGINAPSEKGSVPRAPKAPSTNLILRQAWRSRLVNSAQGDFCSLVWVFRSESDTH